VYSIQDFKSVIDSGYNLLILSFLVYLVPKDTAQAWLNLGSANQLAVISYAQSRNARIIVSSGGSTEEAYTTYTGSQYGTAIANWANANNLDGVDFDLENFDGNFVYGSLSTAQTIQWVANATNAARATLGSSKLITHAPQPPYFGANNGFSNAYSQIYTYASSIDYLNVQYYNNEPATTCPQIFTSGSGQSVAEIKALGIPLSKIVVGKPVLSSDAGSQYITASALRTCITTTGASIGWNTGVFGWQWHDASTNGAWISTIYP